jgi:hypothetical protein
MKSCTCKLNMKDNSLFESTLRYKVQVLRKHMLLIKSIENPSLMESLNQGGG